MFIFAQIVGGFAFLIILISFWQKKRKNILYFNMAGSAVYGLHYLLLGALTGGISNFLGVFRGYIFSLKDKDKIFKSPFIPLIFVLIYAAICCFTWDGIISLLPTSATIIFTITIWLNNPKYIRIFSLLVSACWIAYNLLVLSYVGLVTESILLLSTFIAIIRLDIIKKIK